MVCYIHTTTEAIQIAWMGDPLNSVFPVLCADADLAGCVYTQKSTDGSWHCVRGANTCWPISGISKRQNCVSNSSAESEMVSSSNAIRKIGLPSIELWDALLPHRPKMYFLEDNQAMLQCIRTCKNSSMRHLLRTHRISVAFLHERYRNGDFLFAHENGVNMPADIFTKAFTDKAKWKRARQLINVVLPSEIQEVLQEHKAIFEGIMEKEALPAAPSIDVAERTWTRTDKHKRGVSPHLTSADRNGEE